ncbi:amidase [Eoetvoesiella caeni]|uniref:Aspartyl-tRNA(Asn)/glutamyl-tRNA(Gln) amidotransferase subunit A n=1 Tax=Eoetvoesiella caeni TaxID=645616 RepID=A0A366HDW2_9BURK|nr:amidase family protein [Eoetvoesiella caeni]MCI2809216.1 amidase family protein [Eoetvoesiella caeni]NYT54356.1 amidase [Eoetvoesiella caeni]RBP39456.1 aspartyl-tRNA(Asn)/glutamyl-tRNA(Gln) amidotransferase subunit A [Eoetvoesiella caeni]
MSGSVDSADILAMDIAQLSQQYGSGACSPVDTLDAMRSAIESDTQGINAFCHLVWPAALQAAQASEKRHRAGQALGPLDGVPVSIKDLTQVAGWPTRCGSLATQDDPPAPVDAPSVVQLRAAGAVVFGKTTTTEFGWTVLSENPYSGLTRNPLNNAHSAGGSSSGAAAQVAAGWGPLALGSDAGGSVRIPASYCGLVGFKPTFGLIPAAPASAFAEFAHQGVLTRSMQDCITAMSVFSKGDPRDPSSLFSRSGSADGQERPLRIGWSRTLGAAQLPDADVAAAFEHTLARLSAAGYQLEEVAPGIEDACAAMWTIWCSRVFESFQAWPPSRRELLGDKLRGLYRAGEQLGMAELAASQTRLRALGTALARTFCDIDVLLTPSTPSVAPPAGRYLANGNESGENWFAMNGYAYPFNVSQQPALSIPMGLGGQGLPVGLQIVGRKYHDKQVLQLGSALESLLEVSP